MPVMGVCPGIIPKHLWILASGLRSADLRDMVQRLHGIAVDLATAIKRFDNQPINPITNSDAGKAKA
jgi:hypothetical protein